MKTILVTAAAMLATPAWASCGLSGPNYDVCEAIEANTMAVLNASNASMNNGTERELRELRRQVENLAAEIHQLRNEKGGLK